MHWDCFAQQEMPQDPRGSDRTPPSEEDSAEAERLKTEGEGDSCPHGGLYKVPEGKVSEVVSGEGQGGASKSASVGGWRDDATVKNCSCRSLRLVQYPCQAASSQLVPCLALGDSVPSCGLCGHCTHISIYAYFMQNKINIHSSIQEASQSL